MNTISLNSPASLTDENQLVARTTVPFYLYATVLSSLSIIVGLIWDISWHMTIGRDGLFSAPHLAIYLGGITAGLFSGYRVLKITFAGTVFERAKSVKFWGIFYGSLGNLFCIWGSIAMITSAPFDDWWHNTYGLDVTILSPPHTVLLLGMITIQFGAIISVISYQNNFTEQLAGQASAKRYNLLFALSGGFLLAMVYSIASEYLVRQNMHGTLFYKIAAGAFPLFLITFSNASKTKWGATYAAIVYSLLMMIMVWVLPLFPGEPKLGPVLNPVKHFQPFDFPLLLIFPALAIDWFTHRFQDQNKWMKALGYGTIFLIVFAAVQWPFANVLMASKGHWFFGTEKWYFGFDPNWQWRYDFTPWTVSSGWELFTGLLIAAGIGLLSARLGLAWGAWMNRIYR
jgi:hypothetical protein